VLLWLRLEVSDAIDDEDFGGVTGRDGCDGGAVGCGRVTGQKLVEGGVSFD
jgi:hypothetical protein